MAAALWKLLALAALIIIALGMASAPAATHHQAAAANHCDDSGSAPEKAKHQTDCTASCSVVIAAEPRVEASDVIAGQALARPLDEKHDGLHPEAAIPPPRPA